MKKYTPGPWWVEIGDEDGDYSHIWPTIHSESREIVGTEGLYGDLEEDKANARLIAAAPELLEALQYLMVASGEQLTSAFEQAQEVIAKVTGKE